MSVTGRALGCCVTSLILGGGGPVRAGAALGRRAAWNQTEQKENCAPVCADPVDLRL